MERRAFLLASSGVTAGLPAFAFQDKAPKGRVKIVSSLPRNGSAKGQTDTVVLAGIEKAGSNDREAIRKVLVATKDFDQGALAKWSFEANGDTTLQDLTVSKMAGGMFVSVRSVVRKAPVAKE